MNPEIEITQSQARDSSLLQPAGRRKYQGVKGSIPQNLQDQIESLPEGRSLLIKLVGTDNIKTFQNKIYSYLSENSIKAYFKIYTEGRTLRIRRLAEVNIVIEEDFETNKKQMDFLFDHLDQTEDEEKAEAIILKAIHEETLGYEDLEPIIRQWRITIKSESSQRKGSGWDQLQKTHAEDEDKLKKENSK